MLKDNSGNCYNYIGKELEVFKHALNWKSYFRSTISYAIHGDILEVSAGLGSATRILKNKNQSSWLALEPDSNLANKLKKDIFSDPALKGVKVKTGTLKDLKPNDKFDAILYIDVLEHIENDAAELTEAASHLNPGGKLVVLAPAHNSFYTEFDRAIGHFRRYNRKSLANLEPDGVYCEKLFYLDMFGVLASFANRLFLKQSMPTLRQILIWDRILVPLSRIFDRLFFYQFGKTIVAIWRKI